MPVNTWLPIHSLTLGIQLVNLTSLSSRAEIRPVYGDSASFHIKVEIRGGTYLADLAKVAGLVWAAAIFGNGKDMLVGLLSLFAHE